MHAYIGWIILATVSIFNLCLSFFFSLIETSYIITDDIKMRILLAKTQDTGLYGTLKKLSENRDRYGASLSIAITLTNVTGSTILGSLANAYLSNMAVIIYMVVITYLMLVFARTIPKILARKINEKIITKYARFINIIYIVTKPVLITTLFWVKLFGLRTSKKKLSLTELQNIIDVYRDSGVIEAHEDEIFDNIISVKNKLIEHFISKEKEIFTLNADTKVSSYKSIIKKYKKKKFFVENNGDIVGIAFHRDLLAELLSKNSDNISKHTKKAILIEEDTRIADVIIQMKQSKITQSVIMDKIGEPIGILSMKDIYGFLMGRN